MEGYDIMKGKNMRVAILGGGAMGKVLSQMTEEKDGFELAGVIEPLNGETPEALEEAARKAGKADDDGRAIDVMIDFSHPANLDMLCRYCEARGCAAVIATTGLEERHMEKIKELATKVPVVFSANYSLGVNVMKRIIAEITPILEESFDIEIVEMHHNRKLDAPSGTAKMLLAAADGDGRYDHVYGREGMRKRGHEIGIHTLRGGTVAGEHAVIYAGEDEIIEIKHSAGSKRIFAAGALKAAAFAANADVGFYTMEEILFG